jgi:hypothetical protein
MAAYGYAKPATPRGGAAGRTNPFGLAVNKGIGYYDPNRSTYMLGPPPAAPKPPVRAPIPGNTAYGMLNPGTTRPGSTSPLAAAASGGVAPNQKAVNTAPVSAAYDLNTDPALQQTLALTGLSDEQAQAAAGKQRRDLLLNYGDPNLANSVLGDPTLAAAAAANPTSTLAQLATQRTQGVQDLTEQLNQANLLYSGYRTTQESKSANDYQNALASAASGVGSGLEGVTGSLNAALGQNASQRAQAASDAYNAAIMAALLNPPAAPGADGGGGVPIGAIQPGGGGTAAINLDPTTGAATGYYDPMRSTYVGGAPPDAALNPANAVAATPSTPIASAAAAQPQYGYRNGRWVRIA